MSTLSLLYQSCIILFWLLVSSDALNLSYSLTFSSSQQGCRWSPGATSWWQQRQHHYFHSDSGPLAGWLRQQAAPWPWRWTTYLYCSFPEYTPIVSTYCPHSGTVMDLDNNTAVYWIPGILWTPQRFSIIASSHKTSTDPHIAPFSFN